MAASSRANEASIKPDPASTSDMPSPDSHRVPLDAPRDALRHPDLFMDFAGVQRGDNVLEIGGGDGYTAMTLAQRVGPQGSVLAVNPPQWHDFMAPYLAARVEHGPVPGVTFVERPFDNPVRADETPLDLVVCVLIYHDLLYLDVDRAEMNRRLFAALKPGGRFLIIDHAAAHSHDTSVGGTLHRIGRQSVIEELTAAGFVLAAESDALRVPEDPRTGLAWSNPQPRTDRFTLLFERPKGSS
ncbi:MAG: methyltransferase domain-containing protein [Nannocystales bacterium]